MKINNSRNTWNEHWFQFILRNPDKPWDWYCITNNENVTLELIDKYPDKPWDWEYLSSNPNLTMEFVEKYQDKPWDWEIK